MIHLLNSFR